MIEAAGIRLDGPATLYDPVGCRHCDEVGYVGRQCIFELLEVNDRIRELIRTRAPTQALLAEAMALGMRTMSVDGLHKCLAGLTTIEEVTRVTEDW